MQLLWTKCNISSRVMRKYKKVINGRVAAVVNVEKKQILRKNKLIFLGKLKKSQEKKNKNEKNLKLMIFQKMNNQNLIVLSLEALINELEALQIQKFTQEIFINNQKNYKDPQQTLMN